MMYKKHLLWLPVAALIFGCQEQEPNEAIRKLKSERDSLKTVYGEIGSRLTEIESELVKLDTAHKVKTALVTTYMVEPDSFAHFFEVQGVVEADQSVQITAETAGKVKQILVKEGDAVRAGQTLITLDSDVLYSRLAEVETQLKLAQTVFDKQKNLWDQGIGSEIQFLQAKANKEGLEKTMNTVREQVQSAIVKAPYNGVVDEVFIKLGEMAMPGIPLVRVVNTEKPYLVADVSERYVQDIRKGNPAVVNFSMLNDQWYDAEVRSVGKYINPDNRSFRIYLSINNANVELRPNMLSVVRVRDFMQDTALTVPSSSIMQDAQGKDYIYTAENKQAVKKFVETGLSYDNKTHIKQGLRKGENVIVVGARNIKEGDKIEVKN